MLAISAHIPFVSHMWEVDNRLICAYRRAVAGVYHLTPGWILCMRVCVYITDSTCRMAERVTDEERGRATDALPTPALSQPVWTKLLGCIPRNSCGLTLAPSCVCSVTLTDRIQAQMVPSKWARKCGRRAVTVALWKSVMHSLVRCSGVSMRGVVL